MSVPVTVQRALSLSSRRFPKKIAIYYKNESLTYSQLDIRSTKLANGLLALGLQPGDRVGILLPNCPDYIVFAIACAKAVLCMVPINYRFTPMELALQIKDSGAKAIIFDDIFSNTLLEASLPKEVISICRNGNRSELDFDELIDHAPSGNLTVQANESDLFYLGYTSGTTGKPKGGMITQRNRALAYHYWALEFGITSDDIALHCGPFHHTAPFTFTLTQLFMGGQVVLLDSFDAKAALQAIAKYGVTWAFMVPFMLERVLEEKRNQLDDLDFSSLKMLISGASPLSTRTKEAICEEFLGSGLHEFYGATEAGVVTNLKPKDQSRKIRCVGQPVAELEIQIRDEEGNVKKPNEIGDIWLRGPTLFEGYFNDPIKTAEVKQNDWCNLGDIGRVDEEGFLYLIDRRKDVIKSGGVNIYPIEIEEVILRDTAVKECAVVGMSDQRWGESTQAFIVTDESIETIGIRLNSLCQQYLADYKRPKKIHRIDSLPRNANGKVLKRVLREAVI
ncbi:MAG: acyl--CoA ligase [Polynucleobacter sp.]|nr:acyl--CoA ligase [Polynucleobacter sp.]